MDDEIAKELAALRAELAAERIARAADQAASQATVAQLTAIIGQQATSVAALAAAAAATAAPPAMPTAAAVAPAAPGARMTWAEAVDYYLANAPQRESGNSDDSRAKHITRIIGARIVVESDVHTVRFYRDKRKGEFTPRKTLTTPKTRNNEVELIRRVAHWCATQKPKVIPVDPFAGIAQADLYEPVENVRRNVVEDDPTASLTLEQFLRSADEFDTAMVLLAHSSGMRRGEIARMQKDWIDMKPGADGKPARIIDIPAFVTKGRKGKRSGRQTHLSEEALDALRRYWATLPFDLQRRSPWVFVNAGTQEVVRRRKTHKHPLDRHRGKPLHKDTFSARFRRLQEKAGATGPSGPTWLHDLRRSFITLARRRGEDTSNIKQASGHRTDAAFERYDIHARKDALVVRDRIEKARADELAQIASLRSEQRKSAQRSSTNDEQAPMSDDVRNEKSSAV